jgi:hypothetical protein
LKNYKTESENGLIFNSYVVTNKLINLRRSQRKERSPSNFLNQKSIFKMIAVNELKKQY